MRAEICGTLLLAGLATLAACRAPERQAGPAGGTPTPAGTAGAVEAQANSEAEPVAAPTAGPAADPLTGVVWVRADGGGPPGELRIFLADGSLVETSCVEVYALRTWRRTGPREIVLVEDVEIPARIVAQGENELRLSLALVDGTRQEVAYRKGRPPFVCPELKR